MRLTYKTYGGFDLQRGTILTDFRGDRAVLLGWTAPRNPGSTGRVRVRYLEWHAPQEFYPSVFGLVIVK